MVVALAAEQCSTVPHTSSHISTSARSEGFSQIFQKYLSVSGTDSVVRTPESRPNQTLNVRGSGVQTEVRKFGQKFKVGFEVRVDVRYLLPSEFNRKRL